MVTEIRTTQGRSRDQVWTQNSEMAEYVGGWETTPWNYCLNQPLVFLSNMSSPTNEDWLGQPMTKKSLKFGKDLTCNGHEFILGAESMLPGHEKQWKSANPMWSFVIFCEVTFQKWSTDMMLSPLQLLTDLSMFAIHSDSEAQWNNHGPLVDQDESPHIQPNHLDPMELAAQQNRFHTARLCPSAGSGVFAHSLALALL